MEKTPRYLYDNELPFSSKLDENIQSQLKRIESRRASLIIIDGAIGTGKTTLAVEIGDRVNQIKGFEKVALEIKNHPQLSLGGQEFTGCFRECHKKKLPVVVYDEAGDFSKRGAISRFNALMNRLFETYRGFKILVIVCLPNFNILDNQLFENNIPRMLIHIRRRTKNQGKYEVYSLSQMNWIRYWADKLPRGARHKCYSKCIPNFYGNFLNLPLEREKELDKLSTYGKTQLLKGAEIEMKGLYDYYSLVKLLNRSYIWVQKTIKALKLNHTTIIDKKKYFDKSVLSALYTRIDEIKSDDKRGRRKKA